MKDSVDIMLITAHPDDAEFGAAGSVARWTQEGKSIIYVVCTSGDKGTSDRTLNSADLIALREREQRAAAKLLGAGLVIFLGYRDQELEETPAFRKHIVEILRTYRPHTVVTTDPYRRYIWHRDHRVVGQVVMDAVFPYARDHMAYPDLLEKGLEPHKVREILFFGAENVNFHMDISATFGRKLAALKCHASQVKGLGIDDFEGWLRNRCKQAAAGSPYELAEAFHRIELPK